MSEAGGGVSVGSMYDGRREREQGYGGSGTGSGSHGVGSGGQSSVPRSYGNGSGSWQGASSSGSGSGANDNHSDGALARYASASTSATASASANPSASAATASPLLASASANANGQASSSSTTQGTPKLGNAPITTLPSFLAHYGGLAQQRPQSHTQSPALSHHHSAPTLAQAASQDGAGAGTGNDAHGRLAKLHSSFGPSSSPEASNTGSMGFNYFGTGETKMGGARHASDGVVPTLQSGLAQAPSLSPTDSTHRLSVSAEAPPTLHTLLYGSSPVEPEHHDLKPVGGMAETLVQAQQADTTSFFDDNARGSGGITGGESKDWNAQAKPQTIAERRASTNAQYLTQVARAASFGQEEAAAAHVPGHMYSYDQQPYSSSSSPLDGTNAMVPAPWGFMLPGSEGGSLPNGLGDTSRNVSYATYDGSEQEASGSGNENKAAAAAQSKTGRAGNKRRQKFTRTRTGCLCCRSRRIKCDEGRPTCKRCIIAKRVCEYPEAAPGDSRGNSEETTPQAQGYEGDDRAGKKLKMGDRAFSPSIFQDRSVKIHPPPLPHQFISQVGTSHSWPGIVHPPALPLQDDFSAPGRRGAVDGGDVENKQWWGAHVRDQRSMQEAAWLLGQGLGNLNMASSGREGSVASDGPGGLEVVLNGPQDLFTTPPPNAHQVNVLAPVDLGIRRFSTTGVPEAVNPRMLTTGHLDSFLQPVQPGQAYSDQLQPFVNSHSVPLPAPRNLQGGFDYNRTPSFLSVSGQSQGYGQHGQNGGSDGGMSDISARRVSTISLSELSLGGSAPGPGDCIAPMELLRGRARAGSFASDHYTVNQNSNLNLNPNPYLKARQDETDMDMLTRHSVLGLDNIKATQTGVDIDNGLQGLLPAAWDMSYITDPSASSIIPANPMLGAQQNADGTYGDDGQAMSTGGFAMQDPGSAAALAAAPAMLSTPNFLLPWFPTSEERSLILHYCANAADLMMAIPSGLNPMLAINLPLALHSPRGSSPACDALRVALLGIGAIHQAFLLARSGISTSQTATMFQYAAGLRDTGKEMVRRAMISPGGAQSDATLGAVTSLALIDIFFGGSSWRENFEYARQMIASRGGPAKMLKSSMPTPLADGVTVSAARLNLEILAIYETMGCLTTSEEPLLLSDRWESWWFESSRSTYEEHSVEKQFGMSRTMVHLFSRLTRLLSRTKYSSLDFTEADNQYEAGANSTPKVTTEPLILEARKLNDDVDAWIESLTVASLEHERVQVGNRAYAHAMKILLLRNVFDIPRLDPRVQQNASDVLRHCSTSTALLGMSIDLTWPAIIAACCVDHSSRQWVLTLLEGFKSQCCFDIDTAARIIQEVWRRVDRGDARDDWREVCEDLGLQVL